MRAEPIRDPAPPAFPRRHVERCLGVHTRRRQACPAARGPIPFSRYLEKHNREDRLDTSRNATDLGQRLDVTA